MQTFNTERNNTIADESIQRNGGGMAAIEPPEDENCSVSSSSSTVLYEEDWVSSLLDLEKMADKMTESQMTRLSWHIDEAELRKYIRLAEANFEEIKQTDSLLQQAYDLYFRPDLETAPRIKRKTEAMIERLESTPHFYCPYERDETTEVHVSRWLNNYTNCPEKELLGFTSVDPFEPERHIAAAEPRVSISDTNVTLGKRKREMEEDDIGWVHKSSSEARLVCNTGYRPKRARRAC